MGKFHNIEEHLAANGWIVIPNFAGRALVEELASEVRGLHADGDLRRAGTGPREAKRLDSDARGDLILWLEDERLTAAQKSVTALFEELRLHLNRTLFFGLKEFEAHLTLYPAGGFYEKHVDRFQNKSSRFLSCVLYLNAHWTAQNGGELFLYDRRDQEKIAAKIAPVGGTLACFLSHEVPHEVRPTTVERLSLTGWFHNQDRGP